MRDHPPALHLLTNSRALDEDAAYAVVRRRDRGRRGRRLATPRSASRRQHAAAPTCCPSTPGCATPSAPGPSRRCCWCRRSRQQGGSPGTAGTGSSAAGGGSRSTRPSSRTTVNSRTGPLDCWTGRRNGPVVSSGPPTESRSGSKRSGPARAPTASPTRCSRPPPPSGRRSSLPTPRPCRTSKRSPPACARRGSPSPRIVVRCAPTFASILSGAGATEPAPLPPIERGLLVVVGSHVPMSLGTARRACRRAPRRPGRGRSRGPTRGGRRDGRR